MSDPLDPSVHFLPRHSRPPEKAIASLQERAYDLPFPIDTLWDPWRCPSDLLPWLAWSLGVDLWDDEWPELKRRQVIARTPQLKRQKGTIAGIAAHLSLRDGSVLDALGPEHSAFAGPALNQDQFDAWLALQPQLRIYMRRERGEAEAGERFTEEAFADDAHATLDRGRRLLGRHAFRFDPLTGAEIALDTSEVVETIALRSEIRGEQAIMPGLGTDEMAAADRRFADRCFGSDPIRLPAVYSWTVEMSWEDREGALRLGVLSPGLSLIDTRFERVPVLHEEPGAAFVDRHSADHVFALFEDAEIAFFDRVYLLDPDRPVPTATALSFCDHSRSDVPPKKLELLVKGEGRAAPSAAFADRTFCELRAAADEDQRYWRKLTEAVRVSQSARDRVLIDFECTRPLIWADRPRDGVNFYDQRVQKEKL